MRNFCVNFLRLILQLIPPHKYQPLRLFILQCLVDLGAVYATFYPQRNHRQAGRSQNINPAVEQPPQITFQRFFLAGHAQKPVIIISPAMEGQIVAVGLPPENTWLEIPLLDELTSDFASVDFIVAVPAGTDTAAIRREIEKFLFTDKTFKFLVK
jgi:hypothetical protein